MFFLALIPILILLIAMVGLRWSADRAGGLAYLAALALAALAFGAGGELLAYAHLRALFLALDVLVIIWAAFFLYRVADEAGAIAAIGRALPHLTPDHGMQALLIGWVFATFLQGIGGFGVPVAVTAPVLVGLGFSPLAAVVIPSIGHGWAVTFGSMGSAFAALMSASGLPAATLAPPAALFLGLAAPASGWLAAHAAAGWAGLRRLFLPAALLGGLMGLAQYLAAVSGLWNLGSFAGGIAGMAAAFPLARLFARKPAEGAEAGAGLQLRPLAVALSGYAALAGLILFVELTPGVKAFLGQAKVRFDFPQTVTALGYVTPAGPGKPLPYFDHPGMVLTYSAVLAYLIYRLAGCYTPGAAGRILSSTLKRAASASLSILLMVTMAVVMENAGMTDALARGLAQAVGRAFPLASPWIGALGAFMTGANTNSNLIFGPLQLYTARLLGYAPAVILAAQTAGASMASVLAPAKVVVGASTAGMAGREGEVLRRLFVYIGALLLLTSLLALAGVIVER